MARLQTATAGTEQQVDWEHNGATYTLKIKVYNDLSATIDVVYDNTIIVSMDWRQYRRGGAWVDSTDSGKAYGYDRYWPAGAIATALRQREVRMAAGYERAIATLTATVAATIGKRPEQIDLKVTGGKYSDANDSWLINTPHADYTVTGDSIQINNRPVEIA